VLSAKRWPSKKHAVGGQPPPTAIEAPLLRLATRAWLPCSAQSQATSMRVALWRALDGTDSEERAQAPQLEGSPHKATQDPISLYSQDDRRCGKSQALPKSRPDSDPGSRVLSPTAQLRRRKGPCAWSRPPLIALRSSQPGSGTQSACASIACKVPETFKTLNYKKVLFLWCLGAPIGSVCATPSRSRQFSTVETCRARNPHP